MIQDRSVDDASKRAYLSLLSDLVSLDSSNPPGREALVSDYLLRYAREHGLEARLYPTANPDRNNVVLRLRGKCEDGALAFSGHMDVVPVTDKERARWDTDPFTPVVKGTRLYGRGSCDMKGGLAAALTAVTRVSERGEMPAHDLYLVCTCDEESHMRGAKALRSAPFLRHIERMVICEPTDLTLCTVAGGRTYGTVTVKGETGHGSNFSANVIDVAADLIGRMPREDFGAYTDDTGRRSFWHMLGIRTVQTRYIIPDFVEMDFDARLLPGHATEDVLQRLDALLDEMRAAYPAFEFDRDITDRREPWRLTDTSFYGVLLRALAQTGTEPVEATFYGTTDASVFVPLGIHCVIAGPGDLRLAHRENEYLDLEQGFRAVDFYEHLIRLSDADRPR